MHTYAQCNLFQRQNPGGTDLPILASALADCPPSGKHGSGHQTPYFTIKVSETTVRSFKESYPKLRSQINSQGCFLHTSFPIFGLDTGFHEALPTQVLLFHFCKLETPRWPHLLPKDQLCPLCVHFPSGGTNILHVCKFFLFLLHLSLLGSGDFWIVSPWVTSGHDQ